MYVEKREPYHFLISEIIIKNGKRPTYEVYK